MKPHFDKRMVFFAAGLAGILFFQIFDKGVVSMKQNFCKRLALLVLGLMLDGFGSALIVCCNLGSDPFNVLAQGLSRLTCLQIGTVSMCIHTVLLALILLGGGKRHIGFGTVVGIFIVGTVINACSSMLWVLLGYAGVWVRLLCLLTAPVFVGIGVAAIQMAKLGSLPNDIMPLLIHEKLHIFQYRTIRILYDITLFITGFLLGGTVGAGTVLMAFLIGPCIQSAQKAFCRLMPNTQPV